MKMTYAEQRAIRTALEALEQMRKRFIVDANLHRMGLTDTGYARRASEMVRRVDEARDVLERWKES